ncbi:hypothetical protein CRV01_10315 [Arcobacter sp. CECT 8983]|uniref:hypothetical protein n=1 Tax=Arcobacter sp. CECT 8983 TaxID=2044508 RepID=UPI00100BEA77|nr:hypothetical protein [Arcobacter sp. CECT 8983]RXJ89007.1 hypothetical protein CRV01_10315 [Arcobacter sp. CECT 8983]
MKVHTSRILIFITIVILILSELFSQVVNLFSILGAILVIVIYGYCAKMARKSTKATIWFLVPTIIFTFIPLVIKFWPEEKPNSILEYTLSSLLNNIPLLVSFIIPIILLTTVYYGLKKHEEI